MKTALEAFVGRNIEYYEEKWKNEYSWNWAAFFLTFLWLGYRKMYGVIFGFVGLNLLIDFILYFVTHEIYSTTSSTIMSIIFFIIPSTVLGYTGNYFYKRQAEKNIIYLNKLNYDTSESMSELRKKGGVSSIGLMLAIKIMMMYYFLSQIMYVIL
ncbi:uncharacterized protein YacL [Bacillus thermophilus]|uniref:Uncharacterized protein YacL n=1 Tax=Siminovitchia thermophila TaxID=1245522 RepID=A0ABS2R911_9BACI|nr:DUF2628 domain-containing protein [Siminovitchia thermophila]MBM7716127.1 uncharacterized protein YacL [Siminovitchia thermophila]ONK22424.1 hypothetical protein BLX87_16205 [Bacillus sp. VT-16-64]